MYQQRSAYDPNFCFETFWTTWSYPTSVKDFELMGIYIFVLLLSVFEFGRIFEFHKMHWIKQNWLTILHDQSKIYISICCQAFWFIIHYLRACFDNLPPTFWASNTQNQTYFMPKYRGHFFGSHAKICVTCPIMPILL